MTAQPWLVLVGAYLLGSIPTAYIVGRLVARADIRQLGDGNIGAKNTLETVGTLAGLAVAVADIGKGALAVAMARYLDVTEEVTLLAGLCAVFGHDFSVFLRFNGGQGMATTVGVFGALFPQETAAGLIVLAIVYAVTRSWNLSCGVGLGLIVVAMWIAGQPAIRVLYATILLPIIGAKKLIQVWRRRDLAA
jgi:glycerol-3-phosphate acyltransferase PlsY